MNTPTIPSITDSEVAQLSAARDAIAGVLSQLQTMLSAIAPTDYRQSPVGPARSSIASQVRHCLDHVRTLLDAANAHELDYDKRVRGTSIEHDPAAAIAELGILMDRLASLPALDPGRSLVLHAQVVGNGPSLRMQTTILREFVFVLSHTIHHNALIAVMARLLGIELPPNFGYAPATITHESGACTCGAHESGARETGACAR